MHDQQIRRSEDSISHPTTAATLGVLVWLLLNLLPVREASGQGSIVFNNRILNGTLSQTGHIWGPSSTVPLLGLIGLGSNDSPSGTTPFAPYQMFLIGQGTNGFTLTKQDDYHLGAATTFAQLIGAVGSNQPESSLKPVGQTTTFRSGSALGDLAAITSTLPTSFADAPWATFEIVAWDNSSGKYPTWAEAYPAWQGGRLTIAGHSAAFNVAAIGGSANLAPVLTSAGTIAGFSFNLILSPEPSTLALAGLGAAMLMIARRRR